MNASIRIATIACFSVRRSLIMCVRRAMKYARKRINAGLANSDGWNDPIPASRNQRCCRGSAKYTSTSRVSTMPRPEIAHVGLFMPPVIRAFEIHQNDERARRPADLAHDEVIGRDMIAEFGERARSAIQHHEAETHHRDNGEEKIQSVLMRATVALALLSL